MKTRKLHDKNKRKLKNYNIHIGRKVGDRKQTVTKTQKRIREEKGKQAMRERHGQKAVLCASGPS